MALALARIFNGEVINCDSLQIYKDFDVGTAKLTPVERAGIPHHLLDIALPNQVFTAGDYARCARDAVREIAGRGRLPIVAGGAGFYLRALIDGLPLAPSRDECLRRNLQEREDRRPASLYRLLRRFDPVAARRIHPNDVQKLIRAVEVCLLARRPLSSLAAERSPLTGFSILKLGLDPDRVRLYQRLDDRLDSMFAGGLIDEVRRILSRGYAREIKPLESHGYKQALDVIDGRPVADALAEAKLNTRHYAKRQWTWFRREKGMEWLAGFGDDAGVQRAAIERVSQHLKQIADET